MKLFIAITIQSIVWGGVLTLCFFEYPRLAAIYFMICCAIMIARERVINERRIEAIKQIRLAVRKEFEE